MVKPRENRVPIMMSVDELTAIDDWRFANRVATRSDAVRRLCQIGLVFDDHRKEYVDRFSVIYDAASDIVQLSRRAAENAGSLNDYEIDLVRSSLKTLQTVMGMVDLIRTTTGLANNFKADREIADIIAEAKEILAIGAPSAENDGS